MRKDDLGKILMLRSKKEKKKKKRFHNYNMVLTRLKLDLLYSTF